MRLLWNERYPGIYIDDRTYNPATMTFSRLDPGEAMAFASATRAALRRIEAGPVGKDLLTLISKRCQGIGVRGVNLTCCIGMGQGTLWNRHGKLTQDRYIRTATSRSMATADADIKNMTDEAIDQLLGSMFGRVRTIGGRALRFSGGGVSTFVSYNPFIDHDIEMFTSLGVPTPGYIALAHEMVHALHILSGDKIENPDVAKETQIEEARTVGVGKYQNTRISENAIRREHGLPARLFYSNPGDCDAGALAG